MTHPSSKALHTGTLLRKKSKKPQGFSGCVQLCSYWKTASDFFAPTVSGK